MTQRRNGGPDPRLPLTREEILTAIRASGYPFEVKLMRQFKDAGINAGVSVPRPTPGGEIKEVDVVAQLSRHTTVQGALIQSELNVFVAAKKLNPPRCFIGVLRGEPALGEDCVRATLSGGVPCRISGIPGLDQLSVLLMNGGFFQAFQPLCGRPHLAHWAIGDRKEQKGPWADGDERFREDFATLPNVIEYECRLFAIGPLKGRPGEALKPHLRFYAAALAVDTDVLHLYDPETDKVTEAHWATYGPHFGRPGIIDVVSRHGVAELTQAYTAVADKLFESVVHHASVLDDLAKSQKKFWDELSAEQKLKFETFSENVGVIGTKPAPG